MYYGLAYKIMLFYLRQVQGHKARSDTSKLIFFTYRSNKPNIKFSGRLYQTKIHITHVVSQGNYQSIPPYFIALVKLQRLYKILNKMIFYPYFSQFGWSSGAPSPASGQMFWRIIPFCIVKLKMCHNIRDK